MNFKALADLRAVRLMKETGANWLEDNCLRLSAALSYYSIFSIAPLLVIAISIAGMVLGEKATQGQLGDQLSSYLGSQAAAAIQSMVQSASKPAQSKVAAIVGVVTLLFGASGVFGQLKDALNTIWEVKLKSGAGVWGFIRERFLSFGMVLVIGFLLLVSLMLSTALAALNGYLGHLLKLPGFVWSSLAFALSFAVVTALFATIFKVLPDATVQWRNVWVGAVTTALLFEVGKLGLSWYLGRESTASAYGAAGSAVLVLLWVYYTSLILFFGAEFTRVYARDTGTSIRPAANAVAVTPEMRAQQGMAPGSDVVHQTERPGKTIVVRILRDSPVPAGPISALFLALGVGFAVGLVARWRQERAEKPGQLIRRGFFGLADRGGGALARLTKSAVRRGRDLVTDS